MKLTDNHDAEAEEEVNAGWPGIVGRKRAGEGHQSAVGDDCRVRHNFENALPAAYVLYTRE